MSTIATSVERFVWHEQVSPDPKRAQDFSHAPFGWENEVFKPGEIARSIVAATAVALSTVTP